MFEVKFLRHNKEKNNSNVSQEYSFKKTFNTVTELMQYLDKARFSVSVVNYNGLSHSEWYAFCQKRFQKIWNDRLKKIEFHNLLRGGKDETIHRLLKNYYKKHDL